jgi:hypothetical protein
MGGGRGIPTLIFTCAVVGIGTTIANTKRIVPQNNFFIFLPPFSLVMCLISLRRIYDNSKSYSDQESK